MGTCPAGCQLIWGFPPLLRMALDSPSRLGAHAQASGEGLGPQPRIRLRVRHGDCRWASSWADSCCPGTGSRSFSYSPVLAFMVAGTLCWEVMTAEIPTPYSVPGTRSIGRCRNQRYSVCASGREDGGAGSE